MSDLFLNGAAWFRADFHLHTNADNTFTYSNAKNDYCNDYVNALIKANINVGIITNHNKFKRDEFDALRKNAIKHDIFLLPGVELSVNDGTSGIHTLVVFSDEWIEGGDDYINQFLNVAFQGKTPAHYENEDGRTTMNLIDTIKKLEEYKKDFFLIFAHVEQSRGLWKELSGGRLQELGNDELFKRRTLGFQKVRTHDKPGEKCRVQVMKWLGGWYPAEVEGSDPKEIGEIGGRERCFLKLGTFSFEAVKFALRSHKERLRTNDTSKYNHSHIKQISFEGGILNGQTIRFSPELNTFIGIRGSGKSSVFEALRYVLGIPIDGNDGDHRYKRELVERTLGSGGKVIIDATDRHGQPYQIQRILKEFANVFIDGKLQPGVSIRETVLSNPLFFGQKELAVAGNDSEMVLIEKLLGTSHDDIRRKIAEQKTKVTDIIGRLSKTKNVEELIREQAGAKSDAEHRLEFYKKHNLEEKLQKRLGFDKDIRKTEEGVALIESFAVNIRNLLANHEDELRNFPGYSSTENVDFFKNFDCVFSLSVQSVSAIKTELEKTEAVLTRLKEERQKLIATRTDLRDEFAAIERLSAEELKTSNGQNISTDEFLAAKKKSAAAETALAALTKSHNQKNALLEELYKELQTLNELYREEFKVIKSRLDGISSRNAALKFTVEFKEDKDAFLDFFQSILKGSGIRKTTLQDIVNKYQDFVGIYLDFNNAKKLFGGNPENLAAQFEQSLEDLLLFQTPNKYTVTYHGKELAYHSLGQRASAMILFVLGQRENDVIIIDQPEDDLDNQTIYEDVIKLVRELKPTVQFIFATHNPNIPVLGDAEQVHVCSFDGEKISIQSGGIDDPNQQKMIVRIMEGGQEAFERRKEIYQVWKT
ncbi:MAG: AAA family ATPase [Chitinispirillales bacterium]|jgi:predicted ATPase|nr:AAA family ATPase [Chitinispirillales bacterium]